jgi:hypothetical protein
MKNQAINSLKLKKPMQTGNTTRKSHKLSLYENKEIKKKIKLKFKHLSMCRNS